MWIDVVLWWTGLVTWVVAGSLVAFKWLDWTMTIVVRQCFGTKEFFAFVADRLRRRDRP